MSFRQPASMVSLRRSGSVGGTGLCKSCLCRIKTDESLDAVGILSGHPMVMNMRKQIGDSEQLVVQLEKDRNKRDLTENILRGKLRTKNDLLGYIRHTLYNEILTLREQVHLLQNNGVIDHTLQTPDFSFLDILKVAEYTMSDEEGSHGELERLAEILRQEHQREKDRLLSLLDLERSTRAAEKSIVDKEIASLEQKLCNSQTAHANELVQLRENGEESLRIAVSALTEQHNSILQKTEALYSEQQSSLENKITSLTTQLVEADCKNNSLQNTIDKQSRALSELKTSIAEIRAKNSANMAAHEAVVETRIREKNDDIEKLEKSLRTLQDEKGILVQEMESFKLKHKFQLMMYKGTSQKSNGAGDVTDLPITQEIDSSETLLMMSHRPSFDWRSECERLMEQNETYGENITSLTTNLTACKKQLSSVTDELQSSDIRFKEDREALHKDLTQKRVHNTTLLNCVAEVNSFTREIEKASLILASSSATDVQRATCSRNLLRNSATILKRIQLALDNVHINIAITPLRKPDVLVSNGRDVVDVGTKTDELIMKQVSVQTEVMKENKKSTMQEPRITSRIGRAIRNPVSTLNESPTNTDSPPLSPEHSPLTRTDSLLRREVPKLSPRTAVVTQSTVDPLSFASPEINAQAIDEVGGKFDSFPLLGQSPKSFKKIDIAVRTSNKIKRVIPDGGNVRESIKEGIMKGNEEVIYKMFSSEVTSAIGRQSSTNCEYDECSDEEVTAEVFRSVFDPTTVASWRSVGRGIWGTLTQRNNEKGPPLPTDWELIEARIFALLEYAASKRHSEEEISKQVVNEPTTHIHKIRPASAPASRPQTLRISNIDYIPDHRIPGSDLTDVTVVNDGPIRSSEYLFGRCSAAASKMVSLRKQRKAVLNHFKSKHSMEAIIPPPNEGSNCITIDGLPYKTNADDDIRSDEPTPSKQYKQLETPSQHSSEPSLSSRKAVGAARIHELFSKGATPTLSLTSYNKEERLRVLFNPTSTPEFGVKGFFSAPKVLKVMPHSSPMAKYNYIAAKERPTSAMMRGAVKT